MQRHRVGLLGIVQQCGKFQIPGDDTSHQDRVLSGRVEELRVPADPARLSERTRNVFGRSVVWVRVIVKRDAHIPELTATLGSLLITHLMLAHGGVRSPPSTVRLCRGGRRPDQFGRFGTPPW